MNDPAQEAGLGIPWRGEAANEEIPAVTFTLGDKIGLAVLVGLGLAIVGKIAGFWWARSGL